MVNTSRTVFRGLFAVDGVGGLLTFLIAGFVLPNFPEHLPFPSLLFHGMAGYGLACASYSFGVVFFANGNFKLWLRGILALNVVYLALSILILSAFWNELSVWGAAYLISEKFVILTLVCVEWRFMKRA